MEWFDWSSYMLGGITGLIVATLMARSHNKKVLQAQRDFYERIVEKLGG